MDYYAKRTLKMFLLIVATCVASVLLYFALLHFLPKKCEEQASAPKVSVVKLLREQHRDELAPWEKLVMAIAYAESRFNESAVGKDGDWGILQITDIYVKEANRVSGSNFAHEDAFSIELSLDIFEALNGAKNPYKDKDLAIWLHNKSLEYRKRVMESYKFIEKYEQTRVALTKRRNKPQN